MKMPSNSQDTVVAIDDACSDLRVRSLRSHGEQPSRGHERIVPPEDARTGFMRVDNLTARRAAATPRGVLRDCRGDRLADRVAVRRGFANRRRVQLEAARGGAFLAAESRFV